MLAIDISGLLYHYFPPLLAVDNWKLVPSGTVTTQHVRTLINGTILGVLRTDGSLVMKSTLWASWSTAIPGTAGITRVAQMVNGSILGAATNGTILIRDNLYGDTWRQVQHRGRLATTGHACIG
jgi:hypothetical protein